MKQMDDLSRVLEQAKLIEAKRRRVEEVATNQRLLVGKNGGVKTKEEAANWALKVLEDIDDIKGDDVEKWVWEIMDKTPAELGDENKEPRSMRIHHAICEFLNAKNLRYNEVTQHVEQDGRNIIDRDVNTWCQEILKEYWQEVSPDKLNRYIWSDVVPSYNPILDWFNALPKISQPKGLIKKLISSIEFKDDRMGVLMQKWLCSIVAMVYGHRKQELVLVLIGPQGCGKTEFFLRLLPKELEEYISVNALDQGKDSDILMTQKLLIIDDEFYGKSKKNAEHFKSLTSTKYFDIRKPYGKITERLPRLAVLAGCSNKNEILNDSTGNRRILPTEIESRDFTVYDSIDRRELFAEIKYYYELLGEKSYILNEAEDAYLRVHSEEFQASNNEQEMILSYLEPATRDEYMGAKDPTAFPAEEDNRVRFLTPSAITAMINKQFGSRLSNIRVGQELRQLGFEQDKRRVGDLGRVVRGYYVKLRETGDLGMLTE